MYVCLSLVGEEPTSSTLCGGHVAACWSWFDILLLRRMTAEIAEHVAQSRTHIHENIRK